MWIDVTEICCENKTGIVFSFDCLKVSC